MNEKKIKELKKGEYFVLRSDIKNPADHQVYIKGDYERGIKKYSCTKFSDFCYERFFDGSKTVYTDFTF